MHKLWQSISFQPNLVKISGPLKCSLHLSIIRFITFDLTLEAELIVSARPLQMCLFTWGVLPCLALSARAMGRGISTPGLLRIEKGSGFFSKTRHILICLSTRLFFDLVFISPLMKRITVCHLCR
jgi:hypothetical protein